MKKMISAALAAAVFFSSIQFSSIQAQAAEIQEERKDISECTFVEQREELRYDGSGEKIIMLPPQKYTGSEIKPQITIKDGDYTLEEGTDYRVDSMSLADNVNVNTNPWMVKSVTGVNDRITGMIVIGLGDYKGRVDCTFAILSENQKETEDHLIYSDKAVLAGYDGVTIDGYVGAETEVEIPLYLDGKPVQEINKSAFAYNPTLEKVNITDNVFRIMDDAFYHCGNLSEVKLSRQLWGISNCAFAGCTSLREISLPATMEKLALNVFVGSTALEEIHSESETIYDMDGVLFDRNGGLDGRTNELYFFPPAKKVETYCIPDGTQEIGFCAFEDVGGIKNIIIPSSVVMLYGGPGGAFYGMKNPVNIVYKHEEPTKWILGEDTFYDLPAGSTVTVKNEAMKEAAEAAVSEQCRDNVTVQVATKPSQGFELMESSFVLPKGGEGQLRWTQAPADTTEGITWESSDESVAKVDPVLGKITAAGYGECTITGTDESGHKKNAEVLVHDPCTEHSFAAFGSTAYGWTEGGTEVTLIIGEEDWLRLKAQANGYAGAQEVAFRSENEDVATVSVSESSPQEAYLKLKKPGTAVITATFDTYDGTITDRVTVHVVRAASDLPINPGNPEGPGNQGPGNQGAGKQEQQLQHKKSIRKAYGSKPFSLGVKRKEGNGALSYSSSDKKVISVSSKGVATAKGTGRATITVTAKETAAYRKETVKITIEITPKKQKASVKALKGKKLSVKWKKDARATGYQVQYSTDRKFKKGVKMVTIKKKGTASKTISKLKKGKAYYVRVRSYKSIKVNGKAKLLYGAWSKAAKSKKIK